MAKGELTRAAQKAYSAQLKRIRRQISRMQERGYQLTGKVIPDRPSRINKKSVEKLKKITADVLYKKSVRLTETPEGFKIEKGLEARKAERSAAAKKSAATRKAKQAEAAAGAAGGGGAGAIYAGDVILENIYHMIDVAGDNYYEAAQDLRQIIDEGIQKYGRDEVARLFNEAGQDAIDAAQAAIQYRVGSQRHEMAIDAISRIMSYGEIPTMEEARQRQSRQQESF